MESYNLNILLYVIESKDDTLFVLFRNPAKSIFLLGIGIIFDMSRVCVVLDL